MCHCDSTHPLSCRCHNETTEQHRGLGCIRIGVRRRQLSPPVQPLGAFDFGHSNQVWEVVFEVSRQTTEGFLADGICGLC